jgi:glycerol-3-phosphate dehydrogenase (NAD(P)+)
MKAVAVLGAGSFGTALAAHLAGAGHEVRLWARDPALAADIARRGANPVYLPDIALPSAVTATAALDAALTGAELLVVAVPSHGLRHVLERARPLVAAGMTVVSATKGLEEGTHLRMSQLIADVLGPDVHVAAISGPSFAVEVARGLPTAVVAASADAATVSLVQAEFRGRYLRLYGSADVVGVEIGGALKNVIAIAAGIVDGMGLGPNAQAALITRGLVEITRLACALGGRRETLSGLAGLGDLVLTCTGHRSRNRQVGVELGKNRSLEDILRGQRMVAEGLRTAQAALELGARHGVELPITAQMQAVIEGVRTPQAALAELMLRPQKSEGEIRTGG